MNKEQTLQLESLLRSYISNKTELDSLDKDVKCQNATIKTFMEKEGIDKYSIDGYSVSYTVKETNKVNEEKLLNLLQNYSQINFKALGVIKSKEYVDSEALENAVYNNLLDKELLVKIKDCSTTTKTPTLTLRKGKK